MVDGDKCPSCHECASRATFPELRRPCDQIRAMNNRSNSSSCCWSRPLSAACSSAVACTADTTAVAGRGREKAWAEVDTSSSDASTHPELVETVKGLPDKRRTSSGVAKSRESYFLRNRWIHSRSPRRANLIGPLASCSCKIVSRPSARTRTLEIARLNRRHGESTGRRRKNYNEAVELLNRSTRTLRRVCMGTRHSLLPTFPNSQSRPESRLHRHPRRMTPVSANPERKRRTSHKPKPCCPLRALGAPSSLLRGWGTDRQVCVTQSVGRRAIERKPMVFGVLASSNRGALLDVRACALADRTTVVAIRCA